MVNERSNIRFRHVVLLVFCVSHAFACKPRRVDSQTQETEYNASDLTDEQLIELPGDEGVLSPIEKEEVNKKFGHGSKFDMELDSNREVDQVTVDWDARYTLIMKDSFGRTKLNDEGQPMYRDGIYAVAKVVGPDEKARAIGPKKFVATKEVDNLHDLKKVKGSRLIIEFSHHAKEAQSNTVMAQHRTITLKSVTIRYKDEPGAVFKDFVFNRDRNDVLSSNARYVQAGRSMGLKFPGNLKITRVDVRWGDAKPRPLGGAYLPGGAVGRLKINNEWQGPERNVAIIETQTWIDLIYPLANNHSSSYKIEVYFQKDSGRVHSVRVYYQK